MIKIIACGGTIDKVYFDANSQFEVGEPQAPFLLQEANLAIEYSVLSVLRKDSLDMNDQDRDTVCQAVEQASEPYIVITHGTDTMVTTAQRLASTQKTVVLVGAMQPALFKRSDAMFNLGFAVAAVQLLPAGVYIAMNGRILDPFVAHKNLERGQFEPQA